MVSVTIWSSYLKDFTVSFKIFDKTAMSMIQNTGIAEMCVFY